MKTSIALLLAALAALPARAGPFAEALEQAWARHPAASADPALEEEARARAELAAALTPGPAALSLATLSDRLGSHRGKQEWNVELALPLWLPGQKAARGAEAEAGLAALAARRQALRLELAGEVRQAGWAIAAARAADEAARRRVAGIRALEADVARRFGSGDLARVDANLARGEFMLAQAEAGQAEAALAQAEAAWRTLTGQAPPARLVAEGAADGREPAAEHPRLAALAAASRLAHARLKVARETRRDAPELAMNLLRERDDDTESYGNSVGIRLTIPFSSEARVRQDNAAGRAEAAHADAELALARAALELEGERARQELALAERQLALAAERQPLIADNLRLAEKSFVLGESDLATLLRVRALAQAGESELARLRVARDAAASRLLQSLGVMP